MSGEETAGVAGEEGCFRPWTSLFFGFGGGVAALLLDDAHTDLLSRQGERDEYGLAFDAGEECAAVDGLGDFYGADLWIALRG